MSFGYSPSSVLYPQKGDPSTSMYNDLVCAVVSLGCCKHKIPTPANHHHLINTSTTDWAGLVVLVLAMFVAEIGGSNILSCYTQLC